MINSFEIKNFKSIKTKYFPLRNLNVLLGLNGQGKSSFIQSLLLLRQSNIEQGGFKGWLRLRGQYVNLGESKDVFYQFAKKENLEFKLKFIDSKEISFTYNYEIGNDFIRPNDNISNVEYEQIIKETEPISGIFSLNFQYLNALRINPASSYPKSHNEVIRNRSLGSNGQYTAHFIESYYDEEVVFENLLHQDSFVKDELLNKTLVNKTLINQINLWLGEISPGINVRTTSINQDEVLLEYVYNQKTYVNTNRYKPENVGFGITYSLPVVTALLSAKPGSLIIIENPESHIHPKGQAKLGELISLVAQNDVQIIIETHSDHILNGIRVGVKERKINKDKVILFYFEKEYTDIEQYSNITNIEVDSKGELSEYPKNLLDEWSNQLLKLL
ncbi:MAG TPA: DUF3696 domain-containing protein [Bacteroidales bacterium]|nr:DUF3696 domain-containing protein [Bacteroidales bacterium]